MSNGVDKYAEELRTELGEGTLNQWAEVYALDAVSDAERAAIEEHVSAASEDVRRGFQGRVRQARETLAAAYAVHEADPPADLFSRIVAQLPEGPSHSTTGGPTPADRAGADAPEPPGPEAEQSRDQLATRRQRKQSRTSNTRRWIFGAAAATVLAVGSVTVAQNLQEPSLQEQVAQASDVYSATLEIPVGGSADIVRSEQLNAAVVTLHDIPAPAAGKVYQMWCVPADGSAPESVGTMSASDVAGSKTTVLENIAPYAAVAVTVEPEGGSKTPTLPIVAQIPFDA